MEAVGINQSELARRLKVTQGAIAKIARKNPQGSSHLHRIARELRTTPAYLEGEIDDPDAGAPPPSPAPAIQFVTLQVALPSEDALARMFEGLLRTIDRSASLGEQAQLLAKSLPIGLSQLRDLMPVQWTPAAAAEQPADLATLDPEPLR